MAFEFRFPDVGEGITEGEIISWMVEKGDAVVEGQTLAEVETDKAVVELPSPRSGRIVARNGAEGDIINVGDVLVTIEEEAGAASAAGDRTAEAAPAPKTAVAGEPASEPPLAAPPAPVGTSAGAPAAARASEPEISDVPYTGSVVGFLEEAPEEAPEATSREATSQGVASPAAGAATPEPGPEVLALPSVRALAKELGVDLSAIRGTGAGGRILKQDVQDVAQWSAYGGVAGAATPGGAGGADGVRGIPAGAGEATARPVEGELGPEERVAFRGIRRTMAKRMMESSTKQAQVTLADDVDVTIIRRIREKEREVAKDRGVRLTYMAFVIKACTASLKRFPRLNATLAESQEEYVLKHYYNIGMAVDTPSGLVVPNIKAADTKSIFRIAEEVVDLVARAEERKLDVGELHGGTFTITNFGAIGSTFGTPIVNYPEVAILGMGRVREMPVVHEGKVVIRLMLPLSLTFDHQLIDGAEAARFLNSVIGYLEDPDLLLLEGA